MKDRIIGILKLLFALTFGITAAITVFYFADEQLNGVFLDWFAEKFFYNGTNHIDGIDYHQLKTTLIIFFVSVVVIDILIVALTIYITRLNTERKVIEEAGKMIHTYMTEEKDAFSVFPKKYSGISAEMSEIKADITRKEQMLKEEASRKNDLIAYLAHDLKTPLTSVIGYLSLMDESPELSAEQRIKYVNITLDKAKRLEEMINSFFDIARYNLQQTVIEKERIDLKYMMIQIVEEFYPLLKNHGNNIVMNIPEELTVFADGNELARVFNNILKNAVAYSYPYSEMKISAFSDDKKIHIQFENKGKTIPKQKLDSIFDKFFRLDSARSTNSSGAGLGLAIAKEIVTLHEGTISAKSENEVTVFEIVLPD